MYVFLLEFLGATTYLHEPWSTEELELRGWENGPKWRNCWMVLTPTLLTSEMSFSWPPRYTSIHELNQIINSPNILRLSSLVHASLQELNSCSWIRIVTVIILYTVTDSANVRFDVHFIRHSDDVYKTWYLNQYLFWSSLNFCTRHSNASSKFLAYRTSNLVKRKHVVLLNTTVVQLIKGSKK